VQQSAYKRQNFGVTDLHLVIGKPYHLYEKYARINGDPHRRRMYYYVGIVTGAVLLVGALLILGFGKHVYVNAATGEVIDFSVPILGRIKTRSPLIFFACVGFALIIVCSKMAPTEELIIVDGKIDTKTPVTVYLWRFPRLNTISRSLVTFTPRYRNSETPSIAPSSLLVTNW
jgi:hypothetical protein